MIVIKRRLLFWLIRAYVKKWGKAILFFFVLGLVFFFIFRSAITIMLTRFGVMPKETIGIVGVYTADSLPPTILSKLSDGLTKISDNDTPIPDLATSWKIDDDGKKYTFFLKKNVHFSDGTLFTSKEIRPSFSDVTIDRPDDYTIVFHLKDTYAPFLTTMSRPIFKPELIGTGEYKIKKISYNGSFIQSLYLISTREPYTLKFYTFYPSEEALKIAYVLGEVSEADGVNNLTFKNTSLSAFSNTSIIKNTNYSQLVTLFYNTQDKTLSDKKLRDALSYALPNTFPEGERAYFSISPLSFAYAINNPHTQGFTHAGLLLKSSYDNTADIPQITIATLPKFKNIAETIKKAWENIGVKSNITVVTEIPPVFQVFLGSFTIPKDPDQYTLWHSDQVNNITLFRNARIDKLLADGRKTIDVEERIKIYADFQKYLNDEQPASFLYFPYSYTVKKK